MDTGAKPGYLALLLAMNLFTVACSGNNIATTEVKLSCTSPEVTTGKLDSGYCEVNGYIMSSGAGVAILTPVPHAMDVRDCFLSQCMSVIELTL